MSEDIRLTKSARVVLDIVLKARKDLADLGSYADPQFAPALSLMEREAAATKTLGWMLADLAIQQAEGTR